MRHIFRDLSFGEDLSITVSVIMVYCIALFPFLQFDALFVFGFLVGGPPAASVARGAWFFGLRVEVDIFTADQRQ